jgi:hypothetical protein
MQPNYPNNPYSNAGMPYGGQPYPAYPQVPPQMAQQGVPVQQPMTPNINPAAAGAVPRKADMTPGSAIPAVMPDETTTTAHQKTTLADGTVLPDVIYVKKKGTLFGFIIASVLLIACAVYAVITTISAGAASSKVNELTAQVESKDKTIDTVKGALGIKEDGDLTKENISKLVNRPEGVLDLDLSSFTSGEGVGINSLRLSSTLEYAIVDVNYYGKSTYYYRKVDDGGWSIAFSRSSVVSCRDISKEAMEVIIELGGLDKSTSSSGKQYDCMDKDDGDKLYDFPDAIEAGVYKK